MRVFGSDMHIVTFIFIVIETILFLYQYLFYLQKPFEKKRLYYLILLFLLLVYNITGGLFPDPNLPVSIVLQNILAYGGGFLFACYQPYYFYKAYKLTTLRFHAIYGVPLFFIVPYLLFFVIGYAFYKDIDQAVKQGVFIPGIYAVIVVIAILRAIRIKFKEDKAYNTEIILIYAALVPWVCLPLFSFLKVGQLTEVLVMNGGFILITIIFLKQMVSLSRNNELQLKQLQEGTTLSKEDRFSNNCKKLDLTAREIEIAVMIGQGKKYKEIADVLFISDKTVAKHVQNMFSKARVSNKTQLINELGG